MEHPMNMYDLGIPIFGNLDILQCGAPNEHNSSNEWVYACLCMFLETYNELVSYLLSPSCYYDEGSVTTTLPAVATTEVDVTTTH